MKNKLFLMLVVLSVGFEKIFTTGPDPRTWSSFRGVRSNIASQESAESTGLLGVSDANSEVIQSYPKPNLEISKRAIQKVGGSAATYAPSEAENMLNRIRNGLMRLRIDHPKMFKKYFEFSQEHAEHSHDEILHKHLISK